MSLSKKKSRGESPNEEFENEFYNSNLSKSPDNNKIKNNYCVFDKTKLLGNNNIITQIYSKNKENKLKSFNLNYYNIITQLGQGNFGKIYLVENDKGELFSMKKIILSEELDLEDRIKEYNLCYNLKKRLSFTTCYHIFFKAGSRTFKHSNQPYKAYITDFTSCRVTLTLHCAIALTR